MQAIMVEDVYSDITPGYSYEIDKVLSKGYIKLKGSPRRYLSKCFDIIHKGKKIPFYKAYMIYKMESAGGKLKCRK